MEGLQIDFEKGIGQSSWFKIQIAGLMKRGGWGTRTYRGDDKHDEEGAGDGDNR